METNENLIYVSDRKLPYPVFDADNHMYENRDALTKFLPASYEGIIKYVDIKGRTKLALNDHITNYIPNPTFTKVAVPGGYGLDVSKSGKRTGGDFRNRGQRVRAMPRPGRVLRPRAPPRANAGHGDRPDPPVAHPRRARWKSAWPTTPTPSAS